MRKQHQLALTPVYCAIISVLASNQAIAAANFRIGPEQGTTLPTIVYPGTTAIAYYTITNLTGTARNGYVIEKLPSTAVQNTTGSNCQSVINLQAHASCRLQIDITGATQTAFALCRGSSCTTASVPLNVSAGSSPPMIAAGLYNSQPLPLLARSGDGGVNWSYPTTIFSELSTIPAPATFTGGQFFTASCSGNNCVAAGDEITFYPLLAYSGDGGSTWTYPSSIINLLPADFSATSYTFAAPTPAVYAVNGFNSVSCNGNICVAGGSYKRNVSPPDIKALLAQSTDGGASWTYPDISVGASLIYQAVFWGVSCSGSTCVAVGQDYDNTSYVPFLAQSTNGGAWTYPQSAVINNPNHGMTGSASLSTFYSVNCSGSNCVAVGEYYNATLLNFAPLLAQSADAGQTWTYPPSIINNFTAIFGAYPIQSADASESRFTSASCNSNVCIAAGWGEDNVFPLLAQSTNGTDWTYTISPPLNTANLPSDIQNYSGFFNSVSCGESICVAVGQYENDLSTPFVSNAPLLGQSFDNGVTWQYPTNITTLPSTGTNGVFNSVSCSGVTCVAAGEYNDTASGQNYPLLAQTTDNGTTWTYPATVIGISVLPPGFVSGYFYGSSVSSAGLLSESLQFLNGDSRATAWRQHPK